MVRRGEIRRRRKQTNVKVGKHKKPTKKKVYRFFVDANIPVKDGILDLEHFEKFFFMKYKVNERTENLGKHVRIFKKGENIRIHTDVKVAKRYIKFLTKKYLKKQLLGDWVRIVTAKDDEEKGVGYALQYFPIANEEEEEEESSDED